MTRFFAPVLLGCTTGWVAWTNATDDGRVIVFPLLDRVVLDPAAQGWLTVAILASLTVLATLLAARSVWANRGEKVG